MKQFQTIVAEVAQQVQRASKQIENLYGIELNKEYFEIAKKRIKEAKDEIQI